MGYITRAEMFIRAVEMRQTSQQILADSGPEAAADWLAGAQYKLVGELLENGQMTREESLAHIADIDSNKADFLARHTSS